MVCLCMKFEVEKIQHTVNDFFLHLQIPNGYEVRTDPNGSSGSERYYINIFTGVRWFSAKDDQGKVYFYEENGNESCWRLPSVGQSIQDTSVGTGTSRSANTTASSGGTASANSSFARSERVKRPLTGSTKRIADNYLSMQEEDLSPPPGAAAKTAMLMEGRGAKGRLPVSTPNFQIGGVSIVVVKQGPLHRTKLVENGRRHRKNWSASHAVLTDTFLLFFKDPKAFASMQRHSGGGKPEHCVDLKGARVEWCAAGGGERKSKRSNVFEVTNPVLGLTMLLQDDSLQVSAEWFQEIREVIDALAALGGGGQAATSEEEDELDAARKMSESGQVR